MRSMLALLCVVSAPLPGAEAATITRSVTIGVATKKGEPVTDLRTEEVVISEAGAKPRVLGLEPDSRPLQVAIVVDSSAAMASAYRSDLVAATVSFWKALPAASQVAVWTSGPPSRVVEFGADVAASEARLQSVAPAGKNYALDALVDASRELARRPKDRHVLVYVGGLDIEATRTRAAELQQAIGQAAASPFVVMIQAGGGSAPVGGPTSGIATSFDLQDYLERLARGYGGGHTLVLSTEAALRTLQEVAAWLTSSYRVRYESATSDGAPPKVEVRRKNLKVQVGLTQVEVPKLQ